ncbi:TPA: replisome organizer [Enterococcus faecium]|uniref:replisome organizer n=2 Tax=Enterococcus faecium TaxID=1352 RepID=UPI0011E754D3|nr:replisome organizer [Enterococcus faecium]MCM6864695.1 replisome organizer [Enterococcus faecium]MDQ8594635.1 replisome organizer [Enterococcus faecium]MDV4745674.1 replisome organizer [Enterococcus faecium]TYQ96517.1 replisome organizer [Enterococcus faecium]HCD5065390.1 replisome organizer [Enterococcus faecium]
MAERRMFAKTIIDSDAFLDMPLSTQALYFHLSMRADDDGFINNPKKIQRMVGCGDDDLKLLMAKRFILVFESGVIVIKHWKIHNYIRNDRYKPTLYQDEKALLADKDNKAYTFAEEIPKHDEKLGIPDDNQTVHQMDTQVRLGKVRLGKVSKEIKDITPSKKTKAKPIRHKYGEYKNVLLSDEQMEKLKIEFPNDYQERIERLSEYCESSGKTYKNYLATIRSWARKEKSEPKNASGAYKRTGRREKLPEWAIDQEAYQKKKALERANRQSKAPF